MPADVHSAGRRNATGLRAAAPRSPERARPFTVGGGCGGGLEDRRDGSSQYPPPAGAGSS